MANNPDLKMILTGTAIPPLVKCPSIQQLKQWAEASGDYNPIHSDRNFALNAGLPGVIVPGQLVAAFIGQMVTDWLGDKGELIRLAVSYKGMNFPSDSVTCRGVVKERLVGQIILTVWAENPSGEKTVVGTAVTTICD